MSAADRIRREVIDDVPVFWTPEPRRQFGMVQFRTGLSDETLRSAGVSHVVEHLTLFGLGRRPFTVNGGVDLVRTMFYADGGAEEVPVFLSEVAARVATPPLDRLDAERRVLRTEAARRPPALVSQHLALRYGPQGFGLAGVPEYGLHALSSTDVAAWASSRFTRGNAVAYITGPPPATLRFTLGEGERRPVVGRSPLPGVPDRSWMSLHEFTGVALGLLMPRTAATATAARALTHRLQERLRTELGHSYEVSLAWVPLDASEAMASVFASGLLTELGRVRAEVLAGLEAFAADGPTHDELAWDVDQMARGLRHPDAVIGELESCAFNELVGAEILSMEQHLDEARALTSSEVAAALAAAAERMTLMDGLEGPPVAGRWEAYPLCSAAAVDGEIYAPAARRFWHARTQELIVGGEGVSIVNRAGVEVFTVRYDACLGLVTEGPQATLLGSDGTRIVVDPTFWRQGERAVRDILATVPASLVIAIDGPAADG